MVNVAPISVVIPAYNAGARLVEAVESALRQTMAPRQLIVVDDGSTDDTADRIRPYLKRLEYVFQPNGGASAARNRGIARAAEPFVAFLDADDVWHPRKLELQLQMFGGLSELALLGTQSFCWPAEPCPALTGPPDAAVRKVCWQELVVRMSLLTSSVLVRRSVLEAAGPFDTSLQGPEDRDLFLRIAERATTAILDLPLTGYRSSPGSLSRQVITCERGMKQILRKLDERDAWRGRWLLRRKAYSYMHRSCAVIYSELGHHSTALDRLARSIVLYPLPYRRAEATMRMERPKRMLVNALRLMGVTAPLPQP